MTSPLRRLWLDEQRIDCRDHESALDALLRLGIAVSHSCKKGICQSCLLRCRDGALPATAQAGLTDVQKLQGYFLSCQFQPEGEFRLEHPTTTDQRRIAVQVTAKLKLSLDIVHVRLRSLEPFSYSPGQFVNLIRPDGLTRSYSIASLPQADDTVFELHVRRTHGGRFSPWLHDDLAVGDRLAVSAPIGHCIYVPGRPEQPLLLLATGTGLAPLYGILHDALRRDHSGPIHLFHGSRDTNGLYLVDELRNLSRRHRNFTYTPCLTGSTVPNGYSAGRVHDLALTHYPNLQGWRAYVCGNPNMVKAAERSLYLRGIAANDILADPFYTAALM
jgi:ferredoxin-NADP reductase/ferredoxin